MSHSRSSIRAAHRMALPLILVSLVDVHAATIVVDNAGDTPTLGKCTLREAINAANSNAAVGGCIAGQSAPTVDLIHFSIAGSGLHTITLGGVLPDITDIVTIDGYSQAGSSANTKAVGDDAKLMIEVSGAGLAIGENHMFRIGGNGTTVRGLLVSHTPYNAFEVGIVSSSSNVVIEGNFIGVDATGMVVTTAANSTPIQIFGTGNLLGGTTPAARNVIAGGGAAAIWVAGSANLVQGNYVNVSADGTQALLPPAGAGTSQAIQFGPLGDAFSTIIGGSVPGAGNVLFGTSSGINLGSVSHDTQIKGNYIGVDATGAYALGESVGINTNNSPSGTIIGGPLAGEGNVISGNSTGIVLTDGAVGTIVKGNWIGTDASGTKPVPNSGDGVLVATASSGSIIGGTAPGEGNTIAFNCGNGVGFSSGQGWAILGNSVFSNHGLGISLDDSGVPIDNDAGDADTGTNNLQNFPVITSAPITAGVVNLGGTLNSVANKTYRLDFFSGVGCHRTGYGEGRHFLGAISVLTNGSGNASFGSGMANFAVPAGDSVFTATATDPGGNTSEFSACFGVSDFVFKDGFEGGCSGFD